MAGSYVEREIKLDVPPDFAVPALGPLLPAGGRVDTVVEELRSDYYDTADLALLDHRLTLRRRTGTHDVGWQLKAPHGEFREEIRVDGTAGTVPAELRALLTGVTRGQQLQPLATITTRRSVARLLDAGGTALAEVDDDRVRAWPAGDEAAAIVWREVEVELGAGPVGLLRDLGRELIRTGAHASPSASKLSRALGRDTAVVTSPDLVTVRGVLTAYLLTQQQALVSGDLALRRGDRERVHGTRVAVRRVRSILRTYGAAFEPTTTAGLDGELRWLAERLGGVRDVQVLRARFADTGDAALDGYLARSEDGCWNSLLEALDTPRYLQLLSSVQSLLRGSGWTDTASQSAGHVRTTVTAAADTVAKRLRRATRSGDLNALHKARKAAKRARYAAEAAEPVVGGKARRRARRYRALQDLLGEHQDSVVAAATLQRAALEEPAHAFGWGVLWQQEQERASRLRRKARKVARAYR